MFQSAYSDVVNAGCNKTNLLKKNPWGYLMASRNRRNVSLHSAASYV